mgnify:CR=1 FL=1
MNWQGVVGGREEKAEAARTMQGRAGGRFLNVGVAEY